jgi:hypothetical protein
MGTCLAEMAAACPCQSLVFMNFVFRIPWALCAIVPAVATSPHLQLVPAFLCGQLAALLLLPHTHKKHQVPAMAENRLCRQRTVPSTQTEAHLDTRGIPRPCASLQAMPLCGPAGRQPPIQMANRAAFWPLNLHNGSNRALQAPIRRAVSIQVLSNWSASRKLTARLGGSFESPATRAWSSRLRSPCTM